MALNRVQTRLQHNTALTTTAGITLAQQPAQGNLLVLVVFADKSRTISPPAGQNWTVRVNVTNTSLSYMLATKVAGASEPATINSTLNTSASSRVWCREYSGNFSVDTFTSAYSGETPAGPSQSTGTTGALAGANGEALAFVGADSVGSIAAGTNRQWSIGYVMDEVNIGIDDPSAGQNSGIPAFVMAEKTNNLNLNGESATFNYTVNGVAADQMGGIIVVIQDTAVAVPADLSSPTASNVGATTVTVGASTDQTSGTLYAVLVTSASLLSGITAAQIIAGQDNTGTNVGAGQALSTAINSANPAMNFTGLSDNTTFYGAIVQVNANGNSDIVFVSFTTQVLVTTRSTSFRMYNPITGMYVASTTLRAWTRLTISGAAVDGGASGLVFTTDANGWANLSGLSIEAGAGLVTVGSGVDTNHFLTYPVTFA